ncbi:MAG: hypothetical protein ACAI37_23885 [Chthoniobacter sp.]
MCLPGLFRGAVVALMMAVLSAGTLKAAPGDPAFNTNVIQGLVSTYEGEVRDKADPPYQAGLQRLNDSYRLAIEAALQKFTGAGQLDEVLAARSEQSAFAATSMVPPRDPPGTNAEIVKLHNAWRAEHDRLLAQRTATVKQIAGVYVERWKLLEVEFTKASKLEEAMAARAKRDELVAILSVPSGPATPSAPTAPPTALGRAVGTPPPVSRPPLGAQAQAVDSLDLYASGSNGCIVYINDKEILPKVMRDDVSKIRVSLKEGDVIAVKNQDRFDINSFWLSCIAPSGEFLFATSTKWSSYVPGDVNQWWDVKSAKKTKSVQYAPDTQEYVNLVKKSASSTPHYHKAQPIRCTLKEIERQNFLFYVVTKNDLLPKKVD